MLPQHILYKGDDVISSGDFFSRNQTFSTSFVKGPHVPVESFPLFGKLERLQDQEGDSFDFHGW